MKGRPLARSRFGGGGVLFRVLSGRKWDFLHIFWEKMDVFARFFGEGGLFRMITACQEHVLRSNFENMF